MNKINRNKYKIIKHKIYFKFLFNYILILFYLFVYCSLLVLFSYLLILWCLFGCFFNFSFSFLFLF